MSAGPVACNTPALTLVTGQEVSHQEIYHKLGLLEAKLESVLLNVGERRTDVNGIFDRLRQIEYRVAWAMGAAVVISCTVPFVVTALQPKLYLGPSHPGPANIRP